MARRRPDPTGKLVQDTLDWFLQQPPRVKLVVAGVVLAVGLVVLVVWYRGQQPPHGPPVPPGTVVFMFWNVENLFDDRDDKRNSVDNPYDDWFAHDAAARNLKYANLTEVILRENGGKGPDLLACVEVESLRAAELLRDALNARLPEGAPRYEHVAMRELSANAGRYIAPCLISRLPLDESRTRLLGGNNLRVLRTHVVANRADLCVVVSHWTSQRSDDGTRKGSGRDRYATVISDEYEKLMRDDPDADFLVCGDFNDTPDSDAVAIGLRMTADRSQVVPTRTEPRLLGLLSGKPADAFGTHYYNKPLIYDQIGVSPGMLDDRGWNCDPDSVRVPTDGLIRDRARTRRPWRFGDKDENPQGRGYSDHFPVVVNLRLVAPPQP
jgi:endonuclease/exonuclease/phosphatase family metal-dependent hydrolase